MQAGSDGRILCGAGLFSKRIYFYADSDQSGIPIKVNHLRSALRPWVLCNRAIVVGNLPQPVFGG
jgi:hypothetical protein